MKNIISRYGYRAVRQVGKWDVIDEENGTKVGELKNLKKGKYPWVPTYKTGNAYATLDEALLNLAASTGRR